MPDSQITMGELMGEMSVPKIRPWLINAGDVAWWIEITEYIRARSFNYTDDTIVRMVIRVRKVRFRCKPRSDPDGRWHIDYETAGGSYVGSCHIYGDRDRLYERKPSESDLRAWWAGQRGKYADRLAPDAEIIFEAGGKGNG